MDVHDRYLHLNQRPYSCDECGRSFIRSDDLRRHCRNHRNKEMNKGKHMCSLCGKQFNNTGQRLRHERFSHMDIRNHTCDNCGKKFHTPQQLKRYYFINSGYFIFHTDKLVSTIKMYNTIICNTIFQAHTNSYWRETSSMYRVWATICRSVST